MGKYKKRSSHKSKRKTRRKTFHRAPKNNKCVSITASGKICRNNTCYSSDRYCKIHFLQKLHNRMIDKEDTIQTMAAPVTKNGDVWIGSLASAQHKSFLERYGIKSILNVSGIEPLPHTKRMYADLGIKYHTFTEIDPETKEEKFMPDSKFDSNGTEGGFTKLDFLEYAKKGIKFQKTCPKPVLTHCFTEEHQILTNRGFMFLNEFEAAENDEDLLVAGYDPKLQKIVYEKYELVINPYQENQPMIEMTHNNERRRWSEESDEYGRTNLSERDMPTNSVSLISTLGHRMYVKHGLVNKKNPKDIYWKSHKEWVNKDLNKYKYVENDYQIVKAEELVTDDERNCIKFLACAKEGVLVQNEEPLSFIEELGLKNDEEINTFLEIYGYWLGDGSLQIYKNNPNKRVTFSPVKPKDIVWLKERLNKLIPDGYTTFRNSHATQTCFLINDNKWNDLFVKEYQRKYQNGYKSDEDIKLNELHPNPKSAKWLASWAWDLNKDQSRCVLSGLRFADGDESVDENAIYTSSVRFRDEIERLALHAGYSTHFELKYEEGSNRGVINGKDVIANDDNWKVSYNSYRQYSEPNLKQKRDVSRVSYSGRTWCVTVPHDFIIVRRAFLNNAVSEKIKNKKVMKASRPILSPNCQAGVNRSGSMIAAYMVCEKDLSFAKTMKLLEEANEKRGIRVLTNNEFKKTIEELAHACAKEKHRK